MSPVVTQVAGIDAVKGDHNRLRAGLSLQGDRITEGGFTAAAVSGYRKVIIDPTNRFITGQAGVICAVIHCKLVGAVDIDLKAIQVGVIPDPGPHQIRITGYITGEDMWWLEFRIRTRAVTDAVGTAEKTIVLAFSTGINDMAVPIGGWEGHIVLNE